MFWLVKQEFIALLSFTRSLATKYIALNNEPCMTRPTVIDLNLIVNYYPFLICLGKCNGSCKAIDELSMKICNPIQTKDVNVKVLNIITRISKAET